MLDVNLFKNSNFLNYISRLKEKQSDILKSITLEIDFSSKRYQILTQNFKHIEKILLIYEKLKTFHKSIDEFLKALVKEKDPEFIQFLQDEIKILTKKNLALEKDFFFSYSNQSVQKKDLNQKIILEIRPGTGGEEAALFANMLYKMYLRYSEKKKWKTEILSFQETEKLGCKEAIVGIHGELAYGHLQYEIGGHRVQRIPIIESGGRIHTSIVTVAILPEVEEHEIVINPNDLKIDVYRSSGPGGQSVNTTDSAVRITHIPSKLTVQCQDEKSQHKNKAKAMRVLRARLANKSKKEQDQKLASLRKDQLGSGDRNHRIRTYNFTQNRITDHQINFNIYNRMDEILEGNLELIINELIRFNLFNLKLDNESLYK